MFRIVMTKQVIINIIVPIGEAMGVTRVMNLKVEPKTLVVAAQGTIALSQTGYTFPFIISLLFHFIVVKFH